MGASLIASHLAVVCLLIWILLKLRAACKGQSKRIASLQGKHVVITGGSSGIGFALAKECVSQGASVTLIARNTEQLSHAARLLASSLKPASGSPQDSILIKVADVGDAAAISAAIVESFKWKPVDILICNAGIVVAGSFDHTKAKDLEMVIRTNVLGCVFAARAVIPLMKARSEHHPSAIVFMSSLAGLLFVGGANIYTSTKYAIRGLAEMLRFELMPYDIKVSLVCPGFTETPLLSAEDNEVMEEFARANEILFYRHMNAERVDTVATKTMEAVKRGDFLITTGLEGLLLRSVSRGFVPVESFSDAVLELLLFVPVRLLSFAWLHNAKRVLTQQQCQEDRRNSEQIST